VRIKGGNVAALSDDELALLGGLRLSGARRSRQRRDCAGGRDLERVTSSHLCHLDASLGGAWGSRYQCGLYGAIRRPVKARRPAATLSARLGLREGERRTRACTSVTMSAPA